MLECCYMTKPAKVRIHRMQIFCAKSVRCRCRFVALPVIAANAIQLSYLKVNSYKQTSS